jgi:hypothetical protein
VVIAASLSSKASSILTSMIWAAVFDLARARGTLDRGVIVAGEDQLLEFGGAGDVSAFADVTKRAPAAAWSILEASISGGRITIGSSPARSVSSRAAGTARGVQSRAAPGNPAIC